MGNITLSRLPNENTCFSRKSLTDLRESRNQKENNAQTMLAGRKTSKNADEQKRRAAGGAATTSPTLLLLFPYRV